MKTISATLTSWGSWFPDTNRGFTTRLREKESLPSSLLNVWLLKEKKIAQLKHAGYAKDVIRRLIVLAEESPNEVDLWYAGGLLEGDSRWSVGGGRGWQRYEVMGPQIGFQKACGFWTTSSQTFWESWGSGVIIWKKTMSSLSKSILLSQTWDPTSIPSTLWTQNW